MSFDLNVKVKTDPSTKEWQTELRKHFIDFTFETSIDREKHSGFLPVQWTDDFDETVDSGYELSFDKRKGNAVEYFFSSASSGNEFVAAWMSAAVLTRLGNGTLTDPQEGKNLNGDAAIKHALEVLSAHKEQIKSGRLARQTTTAPPVAIEISDEDLDVLFNWLVSKKIVKDLKTKKGRFEKISSLRIFEPKLVKVGAIPQQFKHLKNLEVLNLSFQKYKTLPEWIGELTNLRSLLANSNELSSLPSGLFQLRHLEELNLSLNKFEDLPGEIGQLKSLRNLNVSQNAIRNIPVSIGELPKLEKLDVIINKITTLPESLLQCNSLFDVRLSGNQLVELPGWLGEMKRIKLLWVQSCGLKKLPESLGALSSLTFLGVAYNSLTELPESVGNLVLLRRIEASHNQLKALPRSIVKLQNLESLELGHNRELRLANDIENLLKLKELRVSSGAITSDLRKRLETKQPMCWTSFD